MKSELATIKGEHDFKNFVNDHKNIPVKTRLIIDQIEISILQKLRPYKTFPTCTVRSYETNNNNGEITNRPTFGYDHKQPPIAPNMEQPYVIRIRIVGSGFLRHMVRRIVGSLLLVARGKAEPGIFVRVLHDGVGSEGDRENDNSEKQPEKGKAKEEEGEKGSNEKENRSAIRRKRNQHRAEKVSLYTTSHHVNIDNRRNQTHQERKFWDRQWQQEACGWIECGMEAAYV